MTMNEYAKSRGLTVQLIAQKLGVSRQCVSQYGDGHVPTVKVLEKTARAMTELGAPTTVVDLVAALYEKKEQEDRHGQSRNHDEQAISCSERHCKTL